MNFADFYSSDVFDALTETGYLCTASERQFATENDLFGYVGTKSTGTGCFLVGIRDTETLYGVFVAEVFIGSNGKANYGGQPVFEGSVTDAAAYIEACEKKTLTVAELKRNLINTLALLNKFDDNISFEDYRKFDLVVEGGDGDKFILTTKYTK